MFACAACMRVYACLLCVFKCTWGLTPGVIHIYSSTLFSESVSLNQTWSSPLRLGSLASLLGGLHFPFPELELKAGYCSPLVFMWVLAIWTPSVLFG